MQENTNKAIAVNSLLLYIKLIVATICELLVTRFALLALGVSDFGLFTVIGSVISFISVFNTIMISTSNRFLSVAIGKRNSKEINEQFNISLAIHFAISVVTLLLFVPFGDLYILRTLNYDGDISNALSVFHITIFGAVLSFIGVPYNGLLIAKEKFFVYALSNVFLHIFKLAFTISLLYFFENKLLVYALNQGIVTALPTLVYLLYCKKKYPDAVKIHLSREISKYKEVFAFSGWVAYGAFACICRNQGAAVLINSFFNTIMNTALGLANSVGVLINNFANSIAQPIAPQITKSYVSGNISRTENLLVMSTKFTYLFILIISTPFLVAPEWIFSLWLGSTPEYVVYFSVLMIVDALISALNSGISNLIFATGKIKMYQVSINTLRLSAIVLAYIVLKMGCPPPSLLWAYIVVSIIIFFVGQKVFVATTGMDNDILWRNSYAPSIFVTIMLLPVLLIDVDVFPLSKIVIAELYLMTIIYFIGLSKSERDKVKYGIICKMAEKLK